MHTPEKECIDIYKNIWIYIKGELNMKIELHVNCDFKIYTKES